MNSQRKWKQQSTSKGEIAVKIRPRNYVHNQTPCRKRNTSCITGTPSKISIFITASNHSPLSLKIIPHKRNTSKSSLTTPSKQPSSQHNSKVISFSPTLPYKKKQILPLKLMKQRKSKNISP